MTLFHGLPSDRVRAIAQGIDGSMWFGTEGGLAKFDGRRTQAIKDPALPGNRILSLKTDDSGALWVGTDSGAARIIGSRVESIGDTLGNAISAIVIPEPGRLLLATEQGKIFECRTTPSGAVQVQSLLPSPLESADRDNPGPLVITSLVSLQEWILAGSLSRGVLGLRNGSVNEPSWNRAQFFIRALALDKHGTLWIGSRTKKQEPGLFTIGYRTFSELGDPPKRNNAPTGTVLTIQPIGAAMFVGTDGNGVFRFEDNKTERFTFEGTAGGLRSDRIYAIFADREGVIWFGTDRGVSRFDPNAPRVEAVGTSPDNNFVRTIFRSSSGHLFAGTNRGLFVYEERLRSWNPVQALDRSIIYALAEDSSGNLLVGSATGFYTSQRRINDGAAESLTFTRVTTGSGGVDAQGGVRAIAQFRGQTYIASFGRGVEQYQGGRAKNVWPREAPSEVLSLHAEGDSQLLVGTAQDGVLFFDGQQSIADPALANFKGVAIRAMTRTSDGTLWLATGRGLYFCSGNNPCAAAAAGNDARALAVSLNANLNQVWCATGGAGLLRVSLDKDVGPVVSQLDSEQGLPSQNAFAVLPPDDDALVLIGTNRGVVRYNPGHTVPTLFATRIIGKRVHQPAELAAGLNLEYPQNSLLLDVAAISSRTFPEQFQYAFVLRDAAGKTIKQRLSRESQFVLDGLQPGRYRVMARAFTKDLIQSEPLIFEFSVAKAPFPWTSTALAILLALTLLALLWALLERRRIVRTSAALVTANHELADARLNLANEAERERHRIARDLHDQTLADLRHLLVLTDQLPLKGNVNNQPVDASALRGEIEDISQEVRRICEDLSPSVLQNVGFSAALEFAMEQAVQHAPLERKFTYEFVCDDGLEEQINLPANVQMQIYRITQEAVNNLCRHAAPRHVWMKVSAAATGTFDLRLEDDGREFDPGTVQNSEGRGLANMQARAKLIDAEISWTRREGGGTVFSLRRATKI
ncbi:MAG TPA: two-component regulator propeller domain-containing protein [Pyrinomonadaceae bacterium]|nr:two-component regulator propeller domain-containing protein [Pyrinomonadaceae bacterium]